MSYRKNFVRTQKQVRISHGKRAFGVGAIEVPLYLKLVKSLPLYFVCGKKFLTVPLLKIIGERCSIFIAGAGSEKCEPRPSCNETDYYRLRTPCDENKKVSYYVKWDI